MKKIKKSKKKFKYLIFIILIGIIVSVILLDKEEIKETTNKNYISSEVSDVILYDLEYKESIKINRGEEVDVYKFKEKREDNVYVKIKYKDEFYMVNENNLTDNIENIIQEKEMFVRTNLTVYKDDNSSKILSYIKKGERLEILGYDKIENGVVNKYKIKYNDIEGYVYSKYLVLSEEESKKVYEENGVQEYMAKMGNSLGGGTATNLDYYPYEKASFEDNVMPKEVRSLYINSGAIKNIDEYIEFAKENNINAFVIDIKDNTSPAYNSPIMKKYSKTNYDKALNDYEDYKGYVKKAIDAGIYVIGRITVFKDSYFVTDHKEVAIKSSNGEPFSHNGSYWPSAYNRFVWEFNVELAKEAVTEIGFNEIQFDYVRFPDRTTKLERQGVINLDNTYDEEKAQALQNFVMYACDEIHSVGGYVSIDVFGESASNYVTAYGQFWPAISNVADVISGMPYPDHFNPHDYGIKEVVWTVPYKLLNEWSKYVVSKQEVIPTPAVVRTWIQTYNTTKSPSVVYNADKISEQIQALYDNGLNGGYMTWNSGSNLVKYKEVSYAFRKVYE
ncbi:MAG: hypothetical protein E7174_04135 [Firmicutes bacterium]|nr:hypothetical protein [Bacillota bacterium]